MEIVASSEMVRKFSRIPEYKMDLGKAISSENKNKNQKNTGQVVIKIKDPFVRRYFSMTGTYLSKTGNIGTLGFYVDYNFENEEFFIFDGNDMYNFNYTNPSDRNIRDYLSDIITRINEKAITPVKLDMNMEEEIEFSVDKNLPQEEFMRQMMEQKKKMEDMNISLGKRD